MRISERNCHEAMPEPAKGCNIMTNLEAWLVIGGKRTKQRLEVIETAPGKIEVILPTITPMGATILVIGDADLAKDAK
jgi:hypothetical protein